MGAGKSTVGQLTADLLNMPFVDLDERIVQREKRSIAAIFATDGEEYFRTCETDLLGELKEQPAAVYATGGGIVVRKVNRQAMTSMGEIVYLNASWPTLEKRLKNSVDRPLVTTEKNWHELKNLWTYRQTFYSEADIIVSVDGLTPMEVAQKILDDLNIKE
ncbi:shikimate kinase [Deltaproteobacteria bacterium IMCC39524]|nr:shikimate kinase [Deltaproteobacteria bacterium IMCC39524]